MEGRDFTSAVRYAERLVAADPLSDRATIGLMEALAASGDVTAALERARVHAAVGKQELGTDVDPSVSALAARLRLAGSSPKPLAAPENQAVTDRIAPEPVVTRLDRPGAKWRSKTLALATTAVIVVAGTLAVRQPAIRRAIASAKFAAMSIARPGATDHDRELVVVADFTTSTPADSAIAVTLTEALRRALSASRTLGAAPESRVSEAVRRLQQPANARLDARLARQVAIGEQIRTVVEGSLSPFGGGYALSLRLIEASSGDVVTSAERTVVAADKLIGVLDTLSRILRERAGDALEVIRAAPPLETLTSSSLEAMSKYAAARRATYLEIDYDKAITLFREAIALDTSFAAAIRQLEFLLDNARRGTESERRSLLARAYAHRTRLTEYERLNIEAWYVYSSTGITPKRERFVDRLQQIVENYPNADDFVNLGNMYTGRRNLPVAESLYRRAIALDSTRFPAHSRIVTLLVNANRVPAAREAVDALARRFPKQGIVHQFEASVAYAEGSRERTRAALLLGTRSPVDFTASLAYGGLAKLNLVEGRVADWKRALHRQIALDSAAGRTPNLPFAALMANYWVFNRPRESLQVLDAGIAASPAERRNLERAILYAQFGRPGRAWEILSAHDSAVKDTTGGWREGTPRREVKGWIFLAEGRWRDAITEFRGSLMLSDGPADTSPILMDAEIGMAFEHAGMADSAIVAYEHYMNTPYAWHFLEDAFRLPWVLEHVAALYEATERRDKARAAYVRLVDLWRDADPELQPRVTQARQRIAALSKATP